MKTSPKTWREPFKILPQTWLFRYNSKVLGSHKLSKNSRGLFKFTLSPLSLLCFFSKTLNWKLEVNLIQFRFNFRCWIGYKKSQFVSIFYFCLNFQMTEQKTPKLKIHLFSTALFFTLILLSLVANFPYQLNVNVIQSKDPELKTILLWNTFFTDQTFGLRYN